MRNSKPIASFCYSREFRTDRYSIKSPRSIIFAFSGQLPISTSQRNVILPNPHGIHALQRESSLGILPPSFSTTLILSAANSVNNTISQFTKTSYPCLKISTGLLLRLLLNLSSRLALPISLHFLCTQNPPKIFNSAVKPADETPNYRGGITGRDRING